MGLWTMLTTTPACSGMWKHYWRNTKHKITRNWATTNGEIGWNVALVEQWIADRIPQLAMFLNLVFGSTKALTESINESTWIATNEGFTSKRNCLLKDILLMQKHWPTYEYYNSSKWKHQRLQNKDKHIGTAEHIINWRCSRASDGGATL